MRILGRMSNKKYKTEKKLLTEYNKSRPQGKKKLFCLAPNTALKLSQSGNVIPCCFNRGYLYGNYPESSLHDIWFGDKIKKLRKALGKNDLSLGCHFCDFHLHNSNFGLMQSKEYDYFSKPNPKGYPYVMEFELGSKCNLQCQMCSGEFSSAYRQNVENKSPYLSPYDEKFVAELDEFIPYLKRVIFIGGEPFLLDIYYKLWEKMIAINPKIEMIISTNGTILNQKIKDLMERGSFYFAISMDSHIKETFESIRVNANFENFMENFSYFYDYSKRHNRWITINVCPLQQNWSDIPELLRMANEKEINFYFNNVYFPYFSTLRSLQARELDEIIDYYKSQSFPVFENNAYVQNMYLFEDFVKTLISWRKEAEKRQDVIDYQNIKKMEEMLIKIITDGVNGVASLTESERNEKIIKHTCTCQNLFALFKGREKFISKAIYNISNLPSGIFYSEMEMCHNDPERLIGRIMQSGN
jgi:MoaA/NifB/PqqE/SkfB family radical SAM enzyme